MLHDTKNFHHIDGSKVVELREGTGGRGEPVWFVTTRIDMLEGTYKNYHSERFTCFSEAVVWFDDIG